MPVFEVLVIEHPTKKQRDEESALERIIAGPKAVVAKTTQGASFKVTRELAGELKDADEDRIEVLVRPFA